ncbi:22701_t:CDS:2, partial [Entrophospora sp. SA101]
FEDPIVSGKDLSELNCSECDKKIISSPHIKSFTTLKCGHAFHRLCLEKKILLAYPNVCPYPNCDEKLDLIEFPRRDSESSGISSITGNLEKNLGISSLDMVDEVMEEDDEEDDSALQSTDPNSNISLASAMIANLNKKLVDRSLIGQRCDFRITCDGFEAVIGLRSGGLPKACSSKRWNDKVDLMVAMRDVLLQEAIENNGVGCKDFRKLFLLQLVCIGLEGKRTVAVRPLEEDKSTLNHIVTIRDELVVKASQLHRDRCSLVHSKPYTFAEQGRVRRKRIQKD